MFRRLFSFQRTGGGGQFYNHGSVSNALSFLQLVIVCYLPRLRAHSLKPDQDNAATFTVCLLIEG
jgi:hypothetical protein